ncbi:hypothetical protein ACQUSR_02070 [Streptomyces sp. P1-3]
MMEPDQLIESTPPKDDSDGPMRKDTMTWDLVGNFTTQTEPESP